MTRKGTLVSEALRSRIVSAIHVGRYVGGERLPNARLLAEEFGVNERVVLAALRTLADEGLVVLKPRSGAYVVPPHPAGGESLPDLGAWLVGMLVEGRARGLPPRELPEYARRCLETRRVRAACIECNDDQLHLLCSELEGDHGIQSERVELNGIRDGHDLPAAVHRCDVLVTTMFHVTEVQALAERLGKRCIAVALRADVIREVERWLAAGPVYYIATDARFEPKLRQMLDGSAPLENLRVLLVGRDDVRAIPADAPTYVMSSAREHVARCCGGSGPGLPIHPPRHFSDEAARELLTFVVRSNMNAFAAGLG